MFDKPTAFILGAGASWHYNYPTGESLVKRVIERTNDIITCFEHEKEKNSVPQNIPIFFEERFSCPSSMTINRITAYYDGILEFLKNFVERLTHVDPPVIDHFLGWNENLQGIGKLMIAWVILDCEREFDKRKYNCNHQKILDEDPFRGGIAINNPKGFKDNWYRFLLYKIVSGCKESSDLHSNQVNFITFNYDVSLEVFLRRGLRAIEFLKKKEEDIDLFLKDRFIHVYGKIRENPFGPFQLIDRPHDDKRISNYKGALDMAYQASMGIRTIDPHDKDNSEMQEKARVILSGADRVYILGYGFDETNSARLDLSSLISEDAVREKMIRTKDVIMSAEKEIYFTNYQDKNSVNKRVGLLLTNKSNTFLSGKDPIYIGGGDYYNYSVLYEKSIRNVYDALETDFDFL